MPTYWLVTPTATSRSLSLEAIDQAVGRLPLGVEWRIEKQYPGGRRHRLRSGVGPAQLRLAG